jgi:cation diffusion facilitator CzcD-associated flavoprotein CzcO
LFAPGPEIYRYLRDTASNLGLYDRLQANSEVVQQRWDDASGVLRLTVAGRPDITARFVISSVGGYINAKDTVDIDGVEDFAGTILRPNAWDDAYETRGKRIAIIGTGSSGVQIAAALSADAERLEVYQRTPAWVLPKVDFDISAGDAQGVTAPRRRRGRQCRGQVADGRRHGRAGRPRPDLRHRGVAGR